MNSELAKEYKAGLRELLAIKGKVVRLSERDRERYPDTPELWVSPYGWEDYDATSHMHTPTPQERKAWADVDAHYHSCSPIIPEGVVLEELTYSEFAGTFVDSEHAVGINAYGGEEGAPTEIRCSCGKYRGLTLRWEGSLEEALATVLGAPTRMRFTL